MKRFCIRLLAIVTAFVNVSSSIDGVFPQKNDQTINAAKYRGQISSDKNCNYLGNNFDEREDVPVESCGQICLNDPNCTHFSWIEGSCFLKDLKEIVAKKASTAEVPLCGFVVNRQKIDDPTIRLSVDTSTISSSSSVPSTWSSTTDSNDSFYYTRPKPTHPTKRRRTSGPFPDLRSLDETSTEKTTTAFTFALATQSTWINWMSSHGGQVQSANFCSFRQINRQNLIRHVYSKNKDECAESCLNQTSCGYFIWDARQSYCLLWSNRVDMLSNVTNNSTGSCGYIVNRFMAQLIPSNSTNSTYFISTMTSSMMRDAASNKSQSAANTTSIFLPTNLTAAISSEITTENPTKKTRPSRESLAQLKARLAKMREDKGKIPE